MSSVTHSQRLEEICRSKGNPCMAIGDYYCADCRCPVMLARHSPAVQKAMGRFWQRYDEVESEKSARASDAAKSESQP